MGNQNNLRGSLKGKGARPVAPPIANFSDEIRYSEVEVSLYSEFSDDEEETSTNTKFKDDEGSGKLMISKYYIS